MNETNQIPMAKVNQYLVDKDFDRKTNRNFQVTLPVQFLSDNKLSQGDIIAVYRSALNPNELIIRIEKVEKENPEDCPQEIKRK